MTGPLQGVLLTVDDIQAAHDQLMSQGVEVNEIWHSEPGKGKAPGLDPVRRSYSSRASFADPDGNQWQLQEVTERLPGRVETTDPAKLAQRLQETALRHGTFEAVASPHDWSDWYAAYLEARESGSTPDEAAAAAGQYMADVKHVVVSPA